MSISQEYFLAADRGDVYIIKGHKNLKSRFKFRVPSHASVSKYYADKTYANLWFILLQVTKGFRFQNNKNVRFISGNFSCDRFS